MKYISLDSAYPKILLTVLTEEIQPIPNNASIATPLLFPIKRPGRAGRFMTEMGSGVEKTISAFMDHI